MNIKLLQFKAVYLLVGLAAKVTVVLLLAPSAIASEVHPKANTTEQQFTNMADQGVVTDPSTPSDLPVTATLPRSTQPVRGFSVLPISQAAPANSAPAQETTPIPDASTSTTPAADSASETGAEIIPTEALSPGQVRFLSPKPDAVLDTAATSVTLQLAVDSQVELRVNGQPVSSSLIGRTETNAEAGLITQTWYGIPLQMGENVVEAIAISPDGTAHPATALKVQVRGEAKHLVVETAERSIPADGRSLAIVRGQLVDARGNRSNQNAIVTLSATAGEFIGEDHNRDQDGFQVEAKQGQFSATLRAGIEAKVVRIRAATSTLEAYTQIEFTTDLRPTLLTGVVNLRLGARGTDYYGSFRNFLPADGQKRAELEIYSAAFGTGRIGNWLFTAAYNSDRSLNADCSNNSTLNRAEVADCNKYPVYGDSSTVDRVVKSRDSLYLRFERNQDYFMWGDYNTQEFATKSQLFSATTRELHGFKGNYNFGNLQLTAFYGDNVEGFQRDTIAPDGTSGFYFLSRRLVIPGSENLFLEAEELGRPGTVVRRSPLSRGQDYEIDYDRGTILFRQPILQTDLDETGTTLVQRIVVTYQFEERGQNNNIYGGRLRYHFSKDLNRESWIGASYLKENRGIRGFELYGADALFSLGKHGQLIAEYAHSSHDSEILGPVSGSAYRLEYEGQLTKQIQNRTYFRRTDTGFANNATTSFVPGQTRYGTQFTAKIADQTNLRFQFDREENKGTAPQPLNNREDLLIPRTEPIPGRPVDNSQTTIIAGLIQRVGKANLEFDVVHRSREDRTPGREFAGSSTQLRSRATVPLRQDLDLRAQYEQTISGGQDPIYPSRVAVGLDWKVAPNVRVGLSQQFLFGGGQYSGNSITSLDIKSDYKLGPDTTMTSRYSILGGASGITMQRAIGLNHKLGLAPGLRMDFTYERVQGSLLGFTGAGTQFSQPFAPGQSAASLGVEGSDSFSVGLEYTDNPNFKASARFEHRNSSGGTNTVFSAAMAGKITPALTALLDYSQASSANQTLAGLGTTRNLKLGLAYRNPESDKFNALFRYEYRKNPSTVPRSILESSGSGSEDHTLALEAIYAPNWRWEFYGKFALRHSTSYLADDTVGSSTIALSQFRAAYRVNRSVDLAAEARFINQSSPNYFETGFLVEAGYYLTPNLRLAAGYAFGQAGDRDFSGVRTASGPYINFTIKLDHLFQGFGIQKLMPKPKPPTETEAKSSPVVEAQATPVPVATQPIGKPVAPPVISPAKMQ